MSPRLQAATISAGGNATGFTFGRTEIEGDFQGVVRG